VQYPALANSPIAQPAPRLPRVVAEGVLDLPFGAHANVSVASGKVAAFLAYVGYDRSNGVATYALRILNDSECEVRAYLLCVLKDGTRKTASPLTLKVPAFSMRDDHIPVRLDITGSFERALIEVHSEETYFTVEAPAPTFSPKPWLKWSLGVAAPLVLSAATALAVTPRLAPLAAPDRVFAGTSLAIPYDASGLGNVEYSIQDRNRVQLSAGMAQGLSGVLHFAIPSNREGSPYTVHVRVRSPFATTEQVATIAAVAAPSNGPAHAPDQRPLIDELRVPSAARAGDSLRISYATRATSGDISLVDSSGATWTKQPLSLTGNATVNVPEAAAGRTVRVVLHAQNGKQQAQSSVETIVLASDTVQRPQPEAAQQPHPAAPRPPTNTPTMTVSSTVVAGGDSIIVRVGGMRGDVRITLEDQSGASVAQGDGSQGALSITAPIVRTTSRYYVVAAFRDGVGEQSIIKPLVVTPR
jgi:hypothetical protein